MKKILKIGLSAGIAFAFMFATSLNLVAQESQEKESTDAVTVTKALLKANMANTLKILNNDFAFFKTESHISARAPEKEPALAKDNLTSKPRAMVTYGVTEENDGRLYLTEEEIDLEDGNCGHANYPCKVIFDPDEVEIKEDAGGRPYIDEQPTNPQYTAIGQGPYTP